MITLTFLVLCAASTPAAAAPCPKSCATIKKSDLTAKSGVYSICPDGKDTSKILVYCDQTTQGGGWMLMLTQDHAKYQYALSVNPLTQNLNVDNPSPTSRYSRDWSKSKIASPVGGSEFLLKRGRSGQSVRFVQGVGENFCGFGQEILACSKSHDNQDCYYSDEYYNNYRLSYYSLYYSLFGPKTGPKPCDKVKTERYFTKGTAYDRDNNLLPKVKYFNGCSHYRRGCHAGDGFGGIGFSDDYDWLLDNGYGVASDGELRWNSATRDPTEKYTYWYRGKAIAPLLYSTCSI